MLYLCHLINGRGQDVIGNSKWVIKSHKAHMVGDLLLAWHDAMACAASRYKASIFATITLKV